MSRSFLYRVSSIISSINKNTDAKDDLHKYGIVFFGSCGLITHCIYAYSTDKNEHVKIVKKYKMVRNGFTEFMIIDDKDRHFNVNNSFWYNKWNSVEDWSSIKEGDELYFKYYGYRMPILGMFPNIYMTNRVEFLDSMTSSQFRAFEYEKANKI